MAATGRAHLSSNHAASTATGAAAAEAPDLPEDGHELPWNPDLESSVQHLRIFQLLHDHGADSNAATTAHKETPLMFAAYLANAAAVDLLCRMGADTEAMRCVIHLSACSLLSAHMLGLNSRIDSF